MTFTDPGTFLEDFDADAAFLASEDVAPTPVPTRRRSASLSFEDRVAGTFTAGRYVIGEPEAINAQMMGIRVTYKHLDTRRPDFTVWVLPGKSGRWEAMSCDCESNVYTCGMDDETGVLHCKHMRAAEQEANKITEAAAVAA